MHDSGSLVRTVLSNVRRLQHVEHRRTESAYWIEGIRHFVQAYDTHQVFDAVVYSPVLLKSDLAKMLVRRLATGGVRRLRVSPEEFRSVSGAERASGIGAVVKQRWVSLDKLQATDGGYWIVVEDVRCSGNLGTIMRTAEATGAQGIILVGDRCDPHDPAVVRASMGGIFHLNMIRTTHEELSRWASRQGVLLVGLSPRASSLWIQTPSARSYGLVLGEERSGMSEQMKSICHTTVRLPICGIADSLNVGVAAGVMMYELVRRSQALGDPTTPAGPSRPPFPPLSASHPPSALSRLPKTVTFPVLKVPGD